MKTPFKCIQCEVFWPWEEISSLEHSYTEVDGMLKSDQMRLRKYDLDWVMFKLWVMWSWSFEDISFFVCTFNYERMGGLNCKYLLYIFLASFEGVEGAHKLTSYIQFGISVSKSKCNIFVKKIRLDDLVFYATEEYLGYLYMWRTWLNLWGSKYH